MPGRATRAWAVVLLGLALGCRTGRPLLDSSRDNDQAPGTIAGVLTMGGEPVVGRKIEAVPVAGSARYSAVTSVTGGFSIPVPPGQYRLQVVLQEGERVLRDPGVSDINESDLDSTLEVVIGS